MAKRSNRRTLMVLGLIGVLALLIVAVVMKNKSKPKGEKVMAEEVSERTIREMVSASGKVFPEVEVKISSDVSGEIVELLVEEGDSVVTGQLLAKIDPDAYQSQVERGVAGVNSAKANLANARSQIENFRAQKEQIFAQLENAREIHKRNEKLKKEGVISDIDYDASLSNMRALEANLRASDANIKAQEEGARSAQFSVQSSEATLKELRTSLRRTTIYSPTDGVVSVLNVEQGERVVGTIQMTGTEMMRIANLNSMEVRVDVSENDIPRVTLGDPVDIEVDAYVDRKFRGVVTQIANSATGAGTSTALNSDQVTNFEVRIRIDASSYSDLIKGGNQYPFRPGMSASVEINTETVADVVSVPIQSVTTREKEEKKKKGNRQFVNNENGEEEKKENRRDDLIEVVFVVQGDSVDMVKVRTGVQDDSYIQIRSGLKAGDKVVSGPYSAIARKLKKGEVVRVVEEDEFYKQN